MDQEEVECRGRDDRLDPDLAGAEPVELLAAVEQDLKGPDRKAQRAEAEPVELLVLLRPDAGRNTSIPRKASTPTGRLM